MPPRRNSDYDRGEWAAQKGLRDIIGRTSLSERIVLGQAEVEIANLFSEASKSYHDNPTALHLRAMNILYEGLKEKGALMLVPSTAVRVARRRRDASRQAECRRRQLTGVVPSSSPLGTP